MTRYKNSPQEWKDGWQSEFMKSLEGKGMSDREKRDALGSKSKERGPRHIGGENPVRNPNWGPGTSRSVR